MALWELFTILKVYTGTVSDPESYPRNEAHSLCMVHEDQRLPAQQRFCTVYRIALRATNGPEIDESSVTFGMCRGPELRAHGEIIVLSMIVSSRILINSKHFIRCLKAKKGTPSEQTVHHMVDNCQLRKSPLWKMKINPPCDHSF